MLNTLRGPSKPSLAFKKAAVKTKGASRLARVAALIAAGSASLKGPGSTNKAALWIRWRAEKLPGEQAANHACRRAATGTGSVKSTDHCTSCEASVPTSDGLGLRCSVNSRWPLASSTWATPSPRPREAPVRMVNGGAAGEWE